MQMKLFAALCSILICGFVWPSEPKTFWEQSPFHEQIQFSQKNAQSIQFENEAAQIVFDGTVSPDLSFYFDDGQVELNPEHRFEIVLRLEMKPSIHTFSVKDVQGKVAFGRFTYSWKKEPTLRAKIRDADKVVEVSDKILGVRPSEEWIQFEWVEVKPMKRPRWWAFAEANLLLILPTTGGHSVSPEIIWTPTHFFSGHFAIRGKLGFSVAAYTQQSRFFLLDFGPLALYQPGKWSFEAGPALQVWSGRGGARFGLQSVVAYSLQGKEEGFLDRAFVGYTLLPSNDLGKIHQLKFGVGFLF